MLLARLKPVSTFPWNARTCQSRRQPERQSRGSGPLHNTNRTGCRVRGRAPIDPIEETVTASCSSLQYDAGADRYTYVWKTAKTWKGSCRERSIELADGSLHVAPSSSVDHASQRPARRPLVSGHENAYATRPDEVKEGSGSYDDDSSTYRPEVAHHAPRSAAQERSVSCARDVAGCGRERHRAARRTARRHPDGPSSGTRGVASATFLLTTSSHSVYERTRQVRRLCSER